MSLPLAGRQAFGWRQNNRGCDTFIVYRLFGQGCAVLLPLYFLCSQPLPRLDRAKVPGGDLLLTQRAPFYDGICPKFRADAVCCAFRSASFWRIGVQQIGGQISFG